jgi:hypothetical protein
MKPNDEVIHRPVSFENSNANNDVSSIILHGFIIN